ncbi:MAG TPA: PhoH family protein [Methanosarcina sp.]|nr:PhoH family protein [Methanosarcina sp.]
MKGILRREPRSKREKSNGKQEAISLPNVTERREFVDRSPLEGKTTNQKRYLNAMASSTIVFGTGPSGVGKTFLATAFAADALLEKRIEHVIVTRPAIETGQSIGFLPGELEEKFDPYLQPFKDVLNRRLGRSHVEALLKNGRIEATPINYLRGRTFRNSVVILDEAQNTTPEQMKMFLTRIGEGSTLIINGDLLQSDIEGPSGLADALSKVSRIPGVRVVEFERKDIVRHGIIQDIIEAYEG